jgi:hypothetical protein
VSDGGPEPAFTLAELKKPVFKLPEFPNPGFGRCPGPQIFAPALKNPTLPLPELPEPLLPVHVGSVECSALSFAEQALG